MESIWKKTIEIEERPSLAGDIETDVLIIGAGMAGILTGYMLMEAGREVTVIEAEAIGSGQTGNTTAKITSQHNLIYDRLLQTVGKEAAREYANANEAAIREYSRIIEKEKISCEFRTCDAYLYSRRGAEGILREVEAARLLGLKAEFTKETELPFPVEGAVRFRKQATFHPLKFLKAVAGRLTVFGHTKALEAGEQAVKTTGGMIKAKEIVFACHFPFLNVPGYYFMRMHQERSYVIAYEGVPVVENMYLGVDEDSLSFRSYGEYLLLGGGKHHAGIWEPGMGYESIELEADKYYKNRKEAARWSAQDCMTLDGIPYIGRFSSSMQHVYVATGFGKWGMTSSMVAACLLRDMILKQEAVNEKVFSPQRFHLSASASTLVQEGMTTVRNFTKKWVKLPEKDLKKLETGKGTVVEYEGEKVGAYKDEKGEVFLVSAVCPHLGCELGWNPQEKSWDCPCHGSRFDYRGRLLDGPAQENISAS
ncbi:MAG: FAD-dependent oxidoreductase [Roseburia sp.]|nr:FAD-dependent oxidoreductase [Roseburia sp.]MCM1278364.1 FAD-dependent oxidoreductase [Robinsoniella sp.]